MKLNMELVKKGLKNQMITIKHMIIFNIISFILLYASNIGTEPTGNTVRYSVKYDLQEYKANLFFVIFFWIIFLLAFSIFYTKFLKKDFKKQLKIHWSFILLFCIVIVIFVLVEFTIWIITGLIAIGLFSQITNYPYPIIYIVLTYIIGYILIDIIREIKMKKIEKNTK